MRELWKSLAVPAIQYGSDVMNWTASELNSLEVTQNKVGRFALGANRYVGVEAIRGDLGWSTFEERHYKGVLAYKVRLERMDNERWVKQIFNTYNSVSKWAKSCVRMINKCNLVRARIIDINGLEQPGWVTQTNNINSRNWSVKEWKPVIDKKVKELGYRKWKDGINRKETLEWYRVKERPSKETWYDGSIGGQLLFKARTQSLELNARTYRWSENGEKLCRNCNLGADETVLHVVVECPRYERDRAEVIRVATEAIGIEGWRVIREGADHGIRYMLGLEKEHVECVIEAMKDFLECAWSKRM